MGGYGTVRIAMRHPDVFSSFYAMSPCCMGARGAPSAEMAKKIEEAVAAGQSATLDFGTRATLASAAAWSPNPKAPPFFLDLPTKDGVPQPAVHRALGGKLAARDGRPIRRAICGGTRRSRSTAATKTACVATRRSCTAFSTATASPNTFELYPGIT